MNTLPVFHPKEVSPRRTQLAVAHDLARKIGLETRVGKPGRERYADRLEQIIGKRSLKGATRVERNQVVRALEAELQARRGLTYAADDFSDASALEILGF